ncbi:MAG TPA: dTDP-4-dehydrorhamnose 3,5-epimerase family protein [Cyclobacteriaceae bacterium]|nr:dTDP-4-dehydrorhamnose 3,5-epimerase family protein [Cyclobacteriaceae bacterium]
MIFKETRLQGAYVIKVEKREDERGSFARSFCLQEFAEHGLQASIVQCSYSFNKKKGTFRGMHYQVAPYAEDKIVSCTHGAILDFIVDLRVGSKTFGQCEQFELSEAGGTILYVPKSFAHGFLTLTDNSQVFYQMTQYHKPDYARGFRYNDPAFNISILHEIKVVGDRDKNYPDFNYDQLFVNSILHELDLH